MLDPRDDWPEPTGDDVPDETGHPIAVARKLRPKSRWARHHDGLQLVAEMLLDLREDAPCENHSDRLLEIVERVGMLEAESLSVCNREAGEK
jgi:hypothetical protein